MDIRRAVDMLSRSYASLSLSTAAARTTASSRNTIARHPLNSWTCHSCRYISSQVPRHQQAAARSADAEPEYDHDMYKTRDSGLLPARNPKAPSSTVRDQQQPRTRMLSSQRNESTSRSSVDDVISAGIEAQRTADQRRRPAEEQLSSSWGQPTRVPTPSTTSRFTSSTLSFPSPSLSPTDSTGPLAPQPRPRVIAELDIHVKPRTGRSIAVDPRKANDLGAKLRSLDSLLARNRVKSDFHRQRFHERPGLKRKRLARERWRRNFKKRFEGVVDRVNELRVQGW